MKGGVNVTVVTGLVRGFSEKSDSGQRELPAITDEE